MPRKLLKATNGDHVYVQAGESAIVTATLYDTTGEALAKASIVTLTLTLVNADDGAVINSRNAQSILDENGGTLATDGTLTLKLQPDDNANVGTVVGLIESHYALLTWTWVDDDSVTLTGKQEFEVQVQPLTTPVP